MAAALSGDFPNLHVGKPLDKSRSKGSSGSRSPSGRPKKATSPSGGLLSPASPPALLKTASGTVVDENSHRRLTNESEGSGRVRTDKSPEGGAVDSSDDYDHQAGSDDETRGRDRDRKSSDDVDSPVPDSAKTDGGDSRITSPAEVKKHPIPHSQVIKSMLEPSISVTTPSGEKISQPSEGVHPQSNFDARRMSTSTIGSEGDEDDIARAKKLGLHISPLDSSVADRHVRMVIRGDWITYHKEAQAGNRNQRTYLACSDLSTEATYALEWTVGTILRDGDTLLAIYAIEDETAESKSPDPSQNKQTEAERERLHQEGAQAGKDANDAMTQLTRQTTNQEDGKVTSKFTPATEMQSATGSVDGRKVGKKEMERLKAIDAITETFLKFVRKTTLQVRCMIEVIHCKSPKHLILGAVSHPGVARM